MAKIYDETNNIFDGGVSFLNPLGITPITVTADGVILNQTGGLYKDGLYLAGGIYTVTVNGIVDGHLEDAIQFEAFAGTGTSKLTVGSTGNVVGDYGVNAARLVNITNSGHIGGGLAGILETADGNYAIINSGEIGSLGDAIKLTGAGTHTITNSGTLSGGSSTSIYATSNSINKVTNSGIISGMVQLGSGNDSLRNTGHISGMVSLGGGDDTLTNSGTIQNVVELGNGNDAFTNSGYVQNAIWLGDGNDKFSGGRYAEYVCDENGSDSYALGAGNDTFDTAALPASDGLIDYVNGGSNDTVRLTVGLYGDMYLADGTSSDFINLDTADKFDVVTGVTYAATTATGTQIGTDIITGFESVTAGSAVDVVFGSASANYIAGQGSGDVLYGGAGNDYLDGGSGADWLSGGTGHDILDGSLDGVQDVFGYLALSESTAAFSGRDLILNFEDGIDKIDFSRLGLTSATWRGANVAFSHTLGQSEVRSVLTASGWMVQLDKNGDAKVDLAIEVRDQAHAISWGVGDFVL